MGWRRLSPRPSRTWRACTRSRRPPVIAFVPYASRFGRAGCPRLDVICPGFISDCLETLEEINQLNRETFTTAGGGSFHYISWGNDSDGAIAALAQQARKVLAGWI